MAQDREMPPRLGFVLILFADGFKCLKLLLEVLLDGELLLYPTHGIPDDSQNESSDLEIRLR